jgi:hypothetical protein
MSIIKRAGDLVYTFRFLRLLTTPFEETEAYKRGIINADGKRDRNFNMDSMENRESYKNYYTPFHRLVFNIKRLMSAAPGGSSRLASYAAALYLIKEQYGVSEKQILEGLKQIGIDPEDLLAENTRWFVLEDQRLSPGNYKLSFDKLLNLSLDEVAKKDDTIRVESAAYPVSDFYGINIYEAVHVRTQQKVYVTAQELRR